MKTKRAKRIEAVSVDACNTLDSVTIIGTSCDSYDYFKSLPAAVEFGGRLLGKAGWNSDSNMAYYRSDRNVALIVK